MLLIYAYFFLGSLSLTWLLMGLASPIAERLNLFDVPGERKLHIGRIPLSGGLILFGSFAAMLTLHAAIAWAAGLWEGAPPPLELFGRDMTGVAARVGAIVLAGSAIYLLGRMDDARGLGVGTRLAVQIGAAALCVLGGLQPTFGPIPYPLGAAISILWIVTIVNGYNMVDGLDGLAAGLGIVACALLGVSLHLSDQPQGAIVLAALAGSLGGFLRYNFHPARVFMGSSGAMTLGFVLGSMSLYLGALKSEAVDVHAFCIPVLIMAMPLYDMASVVYLRLRNRESIVRADNRHFHHRLLRMGFSHRQAAAFVWLMAAVSGLPVVVLLRLERALSLALFAQVGAIILALVVIERACNRIAAPMPDRKARTPKVKV
jgi:UDP-GlcNAc:undecaprenyl-phosphate GlcNAc-1-phosphate transferase